MSVGAVLALLHPLHVIEVDVERTQLVGVRQGKLDVVRRLGRVAAQVRLEPLLVVISDAASLVDDDVATSNCLSKKLVMA